VNRRALLKSLVALLATPLLAAKGENPCQPVSVLDAEWPVRPKIGEQAASSLGLYRYDGKYWNLVRDLTDCEKRYKTERELRFVKG